MPSSPGSRMDLRFIVAMGLVSMFADWLYEGARSIWPQYLALLGASAFLVGLAFGVGDALGYVLRFVTGPLADRRGGYWLETFLGYALQVLAVGSLAFVGSPLAGVALVFLERLSKSLRTPARDALLASAAGGNAGGRAFGIHNALDQVGAVLGSVTAAAASLALSMRDVFLLLTLPGLAALLTLAYAHRMRPTAVRRARGAGGRERLDVAHLAALFLLGASLMPISLVMYRFATEPWLGALLYLLAMASEAILSPVLGGLYDRWPAVLHLGPPLAVAATVLFAGGSYLMLVAGAILYSAATVYGDTIARARAASGGAAALGAVGAAYGLGAMAAGAAYGWLLDVGMAGLAPLVSAPLAALSLALAWRR